MSSLKSIQRHCFPCYHNKGQEIGVPEWETGDKGEGQNGEFCCVFVLHFSKLNLTLVALRKGKGVGGVSNEDGKGQGVGRGGQVSSSLSTDLRVFHSCTIHTHAICISFVCLSILLADRGSLPWAYSAGETKRM